MHRYISLLSFIGLGFSTTINIPSDYSTIQSGIDAANDGDTVLVSQGTYIENLILEKEIVIASHAINDNLDSNWLENEHIQGTVISSLSEPVNPDYGSCLVIRDGNIAPTILGLTFQNGLGTTLLDIDDCAVQVQRPDRSGGGILIYKAYPTIMYNRFIDNGHAGENGEVVNYGGAISHFDDDDVEFDEDRNRIRQTVQDIPDVMIIQNNYFENNNSGDGKNFYSRGFEGSIDVSYSIFDDIDCESNTVNKYVLKSRNEYAEYIQNNISGNCLEGNSIYVSMDGNNNNSGIEAEPVKTIRHALSLVKDDSTLTTTIYVGEGTFSPSITGEQFPISIPDNVHLIGVTRETSILNAEADFDHQSRVLIIERCENVKIANLTITGGNIENAKCFGGGGIYICPPNPKYIGWEMTPSIPVLENLIVTGNHAYAGGGISIWEQEGPSLKNIIISNNTATWLGGGIMIAASVATLTDVDIFENMATEGDVGYEASGGGVFMDHGDAIMENVNIYSNSAEYEAGISLWFENNLKLYNSTIYKNEAEISSGGIGTFSFNGNITITNTIFWENVPNDVSYAASSQATITYSNIDWDGEGNIYANPLFSDAENGDFSLQEGSPCIDAGTVDLDGDGEDDIFEYFGLAPDMGGSEYSFAVTGLHYTIENISATLDWDPIENFQYYKIEKSTDSLFITGVESNFLQDNTYTDNELELNTEYFYRVSAFLGYWTDYSNVVSLIIESVGTSDEDKFPTSFAIHNNYPNPFNPVTTLQYDLPEDVMVNITIYDMMGRKVNTLVSSQKRAGYKSIQWNATNNAGQPVSAGLYLYTIEAGQFRQTKKMVLLK